MTDDEFTVLDELYFVIAFDQLSAELGMPEGKLIAILLNLYQKGWVRILETVDEDIPELPDGNQIKSCFFLASKKGLQAHNSL